MGHTQCNSHQWLIRRPKCGTSVRVGSKTMRTYCISRHVPFLDCGRSMWTTRRGNNIFVTQFRDTVMVASCGPSPHSTMAHITRILSEFQDLHAMCPCVRDMVHKCTAECMTSNVTTMRFAVHFLEAHPPLIYTQASRFTSDWSLKYCVTLQSPWANSCKHIASIIVRAVFNVQPFLHSRWGILLSFTAWC